MAKQTIGIGSTANDGTGDSIRVSFDKVNDNTNEIYSLFGDGSTLAISGDATVSAGALTIATDAVETAMIADDQITFAKIENRYTVLSALGSGTSFSLDFSAATTFTATASGAATFTFSNAVQGQVIDLILTGNFAITFSETGSTFNKVGSTDYDGSVNNLIQIVCTDDSSGAKIYHYSIATYTSDTTP